MAHMLDSHQLATDRPLALLESREGGLSFQAYRSRAALVRDLLADPRLADAATYRGHPAHLAALEALTEHIAELRRQLTDDSCEGAI